MSNFIFLNVNPVGAIESDCVTRAITYATKEDYFTIKRKLNLVAELMDCEMLCVGCYKFLLDEVYGFKRIDEFSGKTINEALKWLKNGLFLVRVDNHLTIVENGKICDTWDCGDEEIRVIWCIY